MHTCYEYGLLTFELIGVTEKALPFVYFQF